MKGLTEVVGPPNLQADITVIFEFGVTYHGICWIFSKK